MKRIRRMSMAAVFCLVSAWGMQASASMVCWTDWQTAQRGTPGTASGQITLDDSQSLSVTYTGEVYGAQVSGGTNYWNPAAPYISSTVENAPAGTDIVQLVGGNAAMVNTISFSHPVVNPVMAILSLGQGSRPVTYQFNAAFDVLSAGRGYWGGTPEALVELPGNILRGLEGHGTIMFPGTFTSISWTVPTSEAWHGFTVGTSVPLPGTLLLLGAGSLIFARRR